MHHLAQLNTARLRAPLDDPRTEGFTSQIAAMNALADGAPGFVWRLQGDQPDYSSAPGYDPLVIVTLSLWESLEALRAFVYHGDHGAAFRRRADWFEARPGQPNVALWWVKAGERPTVPEAMARLKYLELNGPTQEAFTFSKPFPSPGV
jgi:heme-degrading monooxygenase HmoA